MLIAALAGVVLFSQQPAEPPPDLAVISARLGPCSADFTVTDMDGEPIYAAVIHVRVRYGFLGIKRMDLEVGTNSEGRARVEGLPERGRLLVYDITSGERKGAVEQDLAANCKAMYKVSLR